MLVITQLPCCIFIKYLQCYFSFILKYAIFFWGLKYFTVLSLKLLISSPELLFFGAGSLFLKEAIFFVWWNPRGGGGTLIFSHIRRLGLFFLVQNSEFQFLGGFQKNEYFFGYEDFADIFWGVITKLG